MKNLVIFLLISVISTTSYSQKNILNLSDAILKGRTEFAPKRVPGLQWVAGTSAISFYNDDRTELIIRTLRARRPDIKVTVDVLNKAADLELKKMPRVTWSDDITFYFNDASAFYEYNISTKKGGKVLDIPENAANLDYDPKSKMLAYTIDNNVGVTAANVSSIMITKFEDENMIAGQAIARYEFGIGKGTFWSPNAKYLAFYQKDETDVAEYPLLDITVTPGGLRSIKYPMAGQKSEYSYLGIHNTATGATNYIETDGEKDQYLTNVGWSPDGIYVYVAVVNRDQNVMKLNQYEAFSGKFMKTLFEETHPKYVEPEQPVWFAPGENESFYWFSERDGYNHIYKYDVDGKLLGQITKGNWVVDKILGLSQSGDNLIVTGYDESGLNHYAYSINLKSGKQKQLSNNSGYHSYKLSGDGILLMDSYSSMKTPFVTDVITTRGEDFENIISSADPLREYNIGEVELVELKADDGTPLHGRIIKPYNFDEKIKYPVLVYVYGGPHAQMVSNSRLAKAPLWMYEFANRGYIVFTLDNRGSANRGFEFENVIHRDLGTTEIKDQLVGVNYLKSLDYVNYAKMAVHGWSYGGFMATSLMLREPGTFKVGVAGGPVTDWKYYEIMYGERYMDRPEENPEGYEKTSLMNYVNNLRGDLMLIHGTVDDVVVMQHSLDLVKAFVEAGKQVDFFPYPNHPHNVRGKDRVHLMTKVLDYIEEGLNKQ